MQLEYYQNSRGDCEVLDFIDNLSDERCKNSILTRLDDLQEFGLSNLFKIKVVEKMGPNLYELGAIMEKIFLDCCLGLLILEHTYQ